MSIEDQLAALAIASENLIQSVETRKITLDTATDNTIAHANEAETWKNSAESSVTAINENVESIGILVDETNISAGTAAGSAAQALAIYDNNVAIRKAVNGTDTAASIAAGYASVASSVVQQDLSGVTAAALHRSPSAITAMFVYDTSKDSDGGAWTEKCQHTSWYNEPINGKWLGAQPSEANARYEGSVLGDELVVNGTFDTDLSPIS